MLDSNGPQSRTIAPIVLAEVNKGVKSATATLKKKRGSYLSFTPEEKARVAQYGSVHGVQPVLRRFSEEFDRELKENTVRDWIKAYQKELQNKRRSGCNLVVSHLCGKKRSRPFLLGEKVDAEVQTIIRAMRDSGAVVNTSIAIAIAMGVVRK
jgi:transposase-like protein